MKNYHIKSASGDGHVLILCVFLLLFNIENKRQINSGKSVLDVKKDDYLNMEFHYLAYN